VSGTNELPNEKGDDMKKLIVLAMLTLTACGIADETTLGELDENERESLCDGIVNETKTCTIDGFEIEARRNQGTCLDFLSQVKASCTFTVGDFRDCNERELCASLTSLDCQAPECL